jgi:hypothetical protein
MSAELTICGRKKGFTRAELPAVIAALKPYLGYNNAVKIVGLKNFQKKP